MKPVKFIDTKTETCWMTTNDLDTAKSFIHYLLGCSSPETFVIWEPETGWAVPLLDAARYMDISR